MGFTLNNTHNPNLFVSKLFSLNLPTDLPNTVQTMGPDVKATTITDAPKFLETQPKNILKHNTLNLKGRENNSTSKLPYNHKGDMCFHHNQH
jgi:hypothetical protein